MEWQAVGSLQRRFRNCMTGIRAEPFPPGAPEWIDLEIYLKERAAGMAMDAPAVRP
jgi:sulfur-oxidizing protein SoxA